MTQITSLDFLNAVHTEPFADLTPHPGAESPKLVIFTLPKRGKGPRCIWTDSTAEAAAIAAERREIENVFFAVALQSQSRALELARRNRPGASPATVRGGIDSAVVLPGLWVDLDIAGPTHASDQLPPDVASAEELLSGAVHEPSALVRTGGGLHAYWLLREALLLETTADRAAASAAATRLQGAIRAVAAEKGYTVDATADLARVLRLPGTLNHKTPVPRPAEVEYLFAAPERRYSLEDFDVLGALLGEETGEEAGEEAGEKAGAVAPAEPAPRDPSLPFDHGPAAIFSGIWYGCAFIRWCYHTRRTLSRKLWILMVSILARAASADMDGAALCHLFSRGHRKYTSGETRMVIRQMMTPPYGPARCKTIWAGGGWPDPCKGCRHLKGVTSPICLGRPPHAALIPLVRGISPPPWEKADSQAPPQATPQATDAPRARAPQAPGPQGLAPAAAGDERAVIALSTREREVADQALAALGEREANLFRRGGALVQVVVESAADAGRANRPPYHTPVPPAARAVHESRMREMLATHCRFVKPREVRGAIEWRPAHPPRWATKALVHRHRWPTLPRLEGLVEGPVLLADGTVLQKPGYDAASGLYLAPGIEFEPVPARPTERQKEDALMRLKEAVCDFPFAGEAHFSAWLASLLTPLARFAFAGPSPVNLIDANVRGAGKSLLADVCHLIVTGRPAARTPYSRDEAELRKSITAIALKARQLVVIDNVSGPFGSPTLDMAFTTTSWSDRLLGRSIDLELPLVVTWYVTGNNIELRGDMPRRCLHIRLETPLEKPEHRAGFRHRRLLEWLTAERQRLLPAALTLLAAYRAEDRPPPKLRPWGSFEGWSDLIRGTITWLGLADPADTCEVLESAADAATSTRKRLLQGLDELLEARGEAATVHQILEALETDGGRARFETLATALVEAFPRLKAGELPAPVQLGRKLRSLRGRVLGGLCAVPLKKTKKGVLWAIESRPSQP